MRRWCGEIKKRMGVWKKQNKVCFSQRQANGSRKVRCWSRSGGEKRRVQPIKLVKEGEGSWRRRPRTRKTPRKLPTRTLEDQIANFERRFASRGNKKTRTLADLKANLRKKKAAAKRT